MHDFYICDQCCKEKQGHSVDDFNMPDYKEYVKENAFQDDVCPECGNEEPNKVLGLSTHYIRGYGYLDKSGAKLNMDRHAMATDRDPYAEHRKQGDKNEILKKLSRKSEHNSKKSKHVL